MIRSHTFDLRFLIIALLMSSVSLDVCLAQQTEAESPSAGALSDSVWYDSDKREVVPVEVEPEVDDSLNRSSRWLPQADRVRAPTTPSAGAGTGIFGTGLTLANLFGWMLLFAIIIALVGVIVYAFSKAEIDFGGGPKASARETLSAPDEQTIERMKHLPAELRRTDVNMRTEAERLMGEGHFDQAIILLFGHQLLLLDHVGMIRLNRGKTNRKYVREARAVDSTSAGRLQATVSAFERSYFGRHTITAGEFSHLWQANEQLEHAVERRHEEAA